MTARPAPTVPKADEADTGTAGIPVGSRCRLEAGGPSGPGLAGLALVVGVALLCAAYVLSRLVALLTLPIFFDEAHYTLSATLIGRDPLHADPFVEVAYWGVPPLFTWLAAPLTRLMSDPLLAARLASALIGAAGLVGIWRCGRALGGRRVAAAAAGLYVLCPFLLFYQRMAMVDGLLAAVGAFAVLAALRLMRVPSKSAALLLGLCFALASFSKITGPLFLSLPAVAVVAAPPGERRRVLRSALLAAMIGVAAIAVLLVAPGGGSLVAVAHQQQRLSAPFLARTATQLSIIAQSLWLYVTPPVLALALAGLRGVRDEPGTRLLALWAPLSILPFALVHLSLAPRYLLPGAVPLLLLAARGLVALLDCRGERRASLKRALGALLAAGALVACLAADGPLVADPAHAAMPALDHAQYVSGWPAGYPLMEALRAARRLAHGRTLTLVSSLQNPPGDALAVLVGNDPRVHLVFRDFTALERPGALGAYPPATFVVVCRPFGQRIDARRAGLRLALRVPNGDGNGGVDLYVPIAGRDGHGPA